MPWFFIETMETTIMVVLGIRGEFSINPKKIVLTNHFSGRGTRSAVFIMVCGPAAELYVGRNEWHKARGDEICPLKWHCGRSLARI
jgi:hypothetical protein